MESGPGRSPRHRRQFRFIILCFPLPEALRAVRANPALFRSRNAMLRPSEPGGRSCAPILREPAHPSGRSAHSFRNARNALPQPAPTGNTIASGWSREATEPHSEIIKTYIFLRKGGKEFVIPFPPVESLRTGYRFVYCVTSTTPFWPKYCVMLPYTAIFLR